jgi:glutamate synthase (NADPH) small chain
MGELGGFLKVHRVGFDKRDPHARVHDYKQYFRVQPEEVLREQGARCMDCGIPFCHEGCPLGNLIPDWNDLVYNGRWREAIDQLHATNNFPEFTGLICPAPCESACVLDINDDPVTIEQIELGIINRAFAEGWVVPEPPEQRTGRFVAVVGSGPAGLAVAAELNKRGHEVTVFERDEGVGGLMRFGVPDAKLEKWIIDRRVRLLEAEGVRFECNVDVGRDITAEQLRSRHDAVVIATGSRIHRDLDVPGRELEGVHFAMDYLYQRNRWVAKQEGRPYRPAERPIVAGGKRVVVIGGGDTGMDCVSNALRESARDAIIRRPPSGRCPRTPSMRGASAAGPRRSPSSRARTAASCACTAARSPARRRAISRPCPGASSSRRPTSSSSPSGSRGRSVRSSRSSPSTSTGAATSRRVRTRRRWRACSPPAMRAWGSR